MNILYIRKKKCLQNTIVLDLCSNQSASSTKSLSAKRIFFYYSSCSFHWRKKMWIERARWMASYSLIKESHKFNIWHNHSLISIWTNISVCIVLIGHYPHCKERNIDGSMGDDNLNCFSYSGQSPLYFSHCHSSYSIAFRFLLINFFCVGFVQRSPATNPYKFTVRVRIFLISISNFDGLRQRTIMERIIFFFYKTHEFHLVDVYMRKIFLYCTARVFFSYFCGFNRNIWIFHHIFVLVFNTIFFPGVCYFSLVFAWMKMSRFNQAIQFVYF